MVMAQAQQGLGTTASQHRPDFPHSEPNTLDQSTALPSDANKETKESANYRAAGKSNTRCSTCANFLGGGISGQATCKVVAGIVSPDGVSDLWTPKEKGLSDLIKVAR